MKSFFSLILVVAASVSSALASVTVSHPANGATVSSPVNYVATATAPTCSAGVSSIGIYVNNVLKYKVSGSSLNTNLTLSPGTYSTYVQEWDHCNGSTGTTIKITVPSTGGGGGGTANGVTVTSPLNNSTVTSPVTFAATAASSTCATGVSAMGVYANNVLLYKVNGAKLNATLALPSGTDHVVVQEWDHCNKSLTASLYLTVKPASSTTTVSITANPASITAGSSSTLSVSASNATGVTISGSDGTSYTLSTTGGTQAVHPAATTTYTAHATGAKANATASATVTVVPASTTTVSMTANPTSITAGSSSTLTVSATNATAAVTISGSDGSSYTLSTTGGTQAVHPAATTTYTAHATGAKANATASATVTVVPASTTTVSMTANPTSITAGSSSTLTVSATNATAAVTISGSDGTTYTLSTTGGTQVVQPAATTIYTATADGASGSVAATATATVTVQPQSALQAIDHVIFMLQENHTFDNYFGMLNPYREANGWNIGDDGKTYTVDGIDDKLSTIKVPDDEGVSFSPFKFKTTCIDDDSSAWLESYGDVNRYDFNVTRSISMNGFVHTAEGFAKSCAASGTCSGSFTDLTGQRAMGYYDQGFLNYYYYMASQFAVSDRWFSPVSSKSIDNRIATFTGGTTQGLVSDPGGDKLPQLAIANIFQELDGANVSWKIYYTVTQGNCLKSDDCPGGPAQYPATNFSSLGYANRYLYNNPSGAACVAPTVGSLAVGDSQNSFCIDPNHIAPLSTYFTDLTKGTLASFSFIEAGYSNNDEHPGSGQSILAGQQQVSTILNSLMSSPSWGSSVFFLSYDEGGGPYDHVPPVPGHSNQNTDASLGSIPDISQIAVNADGYKPCRNSNGVPTIHCDLPANNPGDSPTDAPAEQGFAAQLGFRVPNIVISPFTRKHYVSHTPMDHTAILKFVENRFIGPSANLTARDAAQPNLLEFFDFSAIPWSTPPTPPAPITVQSLGYNSCTPTTMGP